jgi:cytochrome c oxidase subunit I+III
MTSPHLEPHVLDAERRQLELTWGRRPGVMAWLSETDHKAIGLRFIFTAFFFFALGGLLAAAMRIQLAVPNNSFLSPDLYNQFFTIHGTTMMFLFGVPVMLGMGIYLVPLMVGARAIAFPRLCAFGYWMFLFGGVFLYVMFALNVGPDAGWFSYPPLAGPEYAYGKRADVWAQLITFSELSSLVAAICIAVTFLKMRAPGMSLNRAPLYTWAMAVVSIMIIFAMPSVMIASTCLILDRLVSTHFFNQAEGGDPILWQHLFWFFGHPEVYIIFLPAVGMISPIITNFSRRPVHGYMVMVLSQIATAFIGFGVWVHHMFATGLPQLGQSFFSASSMMIVVPSALQLFCWIATLWTGRLSFRPPLLFVLGFFFIFVIGGLTGVMMASVPVDLQIHDTFFIVAHFHYVLIGGAVFPLLGGLYMWFPKMFGRMLNDRLGTIGFWLLFIGFNMTFFPMHILGLMGMPRRIYTYPTELGWGGLNLLASVGAGLIALSLTMYLINILLSLRRGAVAGSDPWGGESLEWATTSPPPPYNFEPGPTVSGHSPMWHHDPEQPVVVGLAAEKREVLITHVLDAEPDHVTEFPGNSIWPLVTAVTVSALFIGSIFTPWAVIYGSIPVFIALVAWFWPRKGVSPRELQRCVERGESTPLEQAL